MCGICGIINLNKELVREAPIIQMMQIMKHRGPDDEGIFIEENVGLGFVRLSIIDLTKAGHQPMFSNDERYVLLFNGEIYNYIELRKDLENDGYIFKTRTDSEVLLNAFLKWGEGCISRFNGMWAFIIYDRYDKKLFASRDRYGIKPFYYMQTPDLIAFASEIPPLLSLLRHKPIPDYQTIFDYLVFNRTDQTGCTFFEEIKKLQHGYKLSIDKSNLKIEKWYDLKAVVKNMEGIKDPSEFKTLLSSAIGLRLRSDVPVGVCFSGGLDSSSIVSILLKDYNKTDLNTFSAVYPEGQTGNEMEFINEYKTNLKNMFYITPTGGALQKDLSNFIKAHAEPIPSTSPYAQFKVMELAKGKVVVTLDGQGADEELAGYHYFFGIYFKELLKKWRLVKLGSEMFYYLTNHLSIYGLKTFLFFLFPQKLRTVLRINENRYLTPEFRDKFKNSNSISGNLYNSGSLNDALLDHFEYKLEHLLKWEDRNSMWFSLEARVPFLDYRIVEKTLATSSDLIIKNGMTKHLLRQAMKGTLPEKIRKRKDKIGFETPQDDWFRTKTWKDFVLEILNSQSFAERGIINPSVAIKIFDNHLSGRKSSSKEIWKLIHLEMWFREFID